MGVRVEDALEGFTHSRINKPTGAAPSRKACMHSVQLLAVHTARQASY